MKVQGAPEGLGRGMVADKAAGKADGTAGEKAAGFGALLEIDKAKLNQRDAQLSAQGDNRSALLRKTGDGPEAFEHADPRQVAKETDLISETPLAVGDVDSDAQEAVGEGVVGVAAHAGELHEAPALKLKPPLAAIMSDGMREKREDVPDAQLVQQIDTPSDTGAIALPGEQGIVDATSMAMFFTLTNSFRAMAVGTSEIKGEVSKSNGVMATDQPGKIPAMASRDGLGDLFALLNSALPASAAQNMARSDAVTAIDSFRAAMTLSNADGVNQIFGAAQQPSDNIASIFNHMGSLTPVTKQIQSALVQQVSSPEFASRADEAALARNGVNARVNNGSILVTLTPANLGEVTIKLVNRGDVVQIVLQASTDEAAGQIMRDRDTITELVQTLARKSANVVVQTGLETGDGQSRAQEDGSRRGQSGEEGRAQSDMFNAGRDDRSDRRQENTPPAPVDPSVNGEILI